MIVVIIFFVFSIILGIIESFRYHDPFFFIISFPIGIAVSVLLMLGLLVMSTTAPIENYECVERKYTIQQLNDGYISITDKSVNYISDNDLHSIDRGQGISIYYDTDEPYILVHSYPRFKKESGLWYYCGIPCTPSSYEIHLKETN